MQTPMMLFHLIPTWDEWDANDNDIMTMWFALYVNLVASHLAYKTCVCVCAVCKTSTSK